MARLPQYLIFGKERSHENYDYRINFDESTSPGSQIVDILSYLETNSEEETSAGSKKSGKEIIRADLKRGEGTSTITDINTGKNIFTERRDKYAGKTKGLFGKLRWYASLVIPDLEYISYDPQEEINLSPSHNVLIEYGTTQANNKDLFYTIKRSKIKDFGPESTKMLFWDPSFKERTLLYLDNEPKYLEIIDRNFKNIVPTEEYFKGAKNEKIRKLGMAASKIISIIPWKVREMNSGVEVHLVNGDERKELLVSRRDYPNLDQFMFNRPLLHVSALEGKLNYDVGVDGTYWGASEYNPEYYKKDIIDSSTKSRPINYPGKHYGLGNLTPYVKSIWIKKVGDDAENPTEGAQVDIDTNREYRDIVFDFSLLRSREKLFDFTDIASDESARDVLWSYLNNKRQWLDYMTLQSGLDNWLKDTRFSQDKENQINILKRNPVSKNENNVGRLEISGDELIFRGRKGYAIEVGSTENKNGAIEIYTDGKDRVGDILLQRNFLQKSRRKSRDADVERSDYTNYVRFTKNHKKDGALDMKAILASTLMQDTLNLSNNPTSRRVYNLQTRLEPAIDLLNIALYRDSNEIYGENNLGIYTYTSQALPANTTPDIAYLYKIIFPSIKDEDIEPFTNWQNEPIKEKTQFKVPWWTQWKNRIVSSD